MKRKNLIGTLTGKLIILLFFTSFIPVFISLTYIFIQSKEILFSNFETSLNYQSLYFKNFFVNNPNFITLAKLLASDDELKIKIFLRLKYQINNRIKYFFTENNFDIIRIFDDKKNLITFFSKKNFTFSNFSFDNLLKNKIIIKIEKIDNDYFYSVAVPIKDIKSELILGTLIISYKIDDLFLKNFDIYKRDIVFLSNKKDIIAKQKTIIQNIELTKENFGLYNYYFKIYSLSEHLLNSEEELYMYYGMNNLELRNALNNLIIKYFIILFILMTILYFLAYFLGKKFTAPLNTLLKMTQKISEGNMNIRFNEDRKDEIGELYRSFNFMLNSIQNYQQSLVNTARLASIGQIAAGISHEINNPLVTILGYTQLILEQIKQNKLDKEKLVNYLQIIESDAKRSKNIISNLLNFSRQKSSVKIKININKIIIDTLLLIKHRIKNTNIKIILRLSEKIKLIESDPEQIKQIILNLIFNSIDALKNKKNNSFIEIKTYNHNDEIIFEVMDNGEGIKPEYLDKIFEPFFTTKETGKGTGLGLSIVKNIIDWYNWKIDVESIENRFTKFTIHIK
ncbi:MAG TPA: HAMP domain-containing sensor histidine kinase [bacterium]|nr:HAMP domain-containing sensor histidine kinase [bacterium]HOL46602.1 HAMP domain-containing sensor histidine kinase [bacterium]HPQ17827.1 HAMP domain-containing sensor histidine kinase [bacterium]